MTQTVVKVSRHSYADTVAQLESTIAKAGGTVFATIDQSAAAEAVGMTLRPTTLIVFGNPKGGTPLMAAFPLVALDLPLRVVVWEDEGRVSVAYTPPQAFVERYDLKGQDNTISAMSHQLEALVASVT